MHPVEYQEVKRRLQITIGLVVLLVGLGLLGFTLLVYYANYVRDVTREPIIDIIFGASGLAGLLCTLVGVRLFSGRRTAADALLLSPTAWRWIGIVFIFLSLLLIFRGRLALALPGLAFGLLCFLAARSILLIRLRRSGH